MVNRRRTRSPALESGAMSDISSDVQISNQFTNIRRNNGFEKEHDFNTKRLATIHFGDKGRAFA